MSMFSSASKAISTLFDTVGDVGNATQKSISMATGYIDRRAISMALTDKEEVILATTLTLEAVQKELEGNAKRQALFDEVAKNFA